MLVDLTRFPCAICGKQILNSENAMACPKCKTVMHKACREKNGGCANPHCDEKGADTVKTSNPVETNSTADAIAMVKLGLTDLQDSQDVISVRKIMSDLAGTGIMESGYSVAMTTGGAEKMQTYYQRAMLEQNWIIIRQLDRLNSNIEKLLEK